jgi:serine phosphatase RsbU (regulator of sigma subunit)
MRRAIEQLPASVAPACVVDAILDAACTHAGCPHQEDDIALLVLKRH